MFSIRLVAAVLLFAVQPANSFAEDLQNDTIRETISGRNVVLSTMGFEFPLVYAEGGSVTGDGTKAGLAKFFAPKETGQWWVENDRLCQKFPTWYDGKTWCFKLEKVDAKQLKWERDDGFTGKAWIGG